MKTIQFNQKMVALGLTLFVSSVGSVVHAQTDQQVPNSHLESLEYVDGPTAKLDMKELEGIKIYASDASSSINLLLRQTSRLSSSAEIKTKLYKGIAQIIKESKDSRATLLLTHALQAAMTLVKLIERDSIQNQAVGGAPEGTVDQEIRLMKQALLFATDYYESDFAFIEGAMQKNEIKTNPKFVEFGVKITQFLIKMSDGVLSAKTSYGMVRWSVAVLAQYIQKDQILKFAYAKTLENIMNTLLEKDESGEPVFPDLVNGEIAQSDYQCLQNIRALKFLMQNSLDDMKKKKIEGIDLSGVAKSISVKTISEETVQKQINTPDKHVISYREKANGESKSFTDLRYSVNGGEYKIHACEYLDFDYVCRALGYQNAKIHVAEKVGKNEWIAMIDRTGKFVETTSFNETGVRHSYVTEVSCVK